MKVQFFPLAQDAAVGSYMTSCATFKFTSFLGWMLTVRTNTVYLMSSLSSLSIVFARKSKWTARSCNKSGSTAGAGVGLSEDSRSLSLPQTRLLFSSSFTHTESCWSTGEGESGFQANFSSSLTHTESCWSSGEGKSGFPANFFSRKCACLLLERANAEGEFLFFRRRITSFTARCRPWLCLEFWWEVCS